jgi:hypothetical protein
MSNNTAEKYCQDACKSYREGRLDQAAALFDSALQHSTTSYEKGRLLYNIALCHHKKGDKTSTLQFLERAASADKHVRTAICSAKEFPDVKDEPGFLEMVSKYPPPGIWLAIYTFVRIPLAFLAVMRGALPTRVLPANIRLAIEIAYLCLYAALFVGLVKHRRWAWHLVFVALFSDVLMMAIVQIRVVMVIGLDKMIGYSIASAIAVFLIWVWPNMTYFSKRKCIFRN